MINTVAPGVLGRNLSQSIRCSDPQGSGRGKESINPAKMRLCPGSHSLSHVASSTIFCSGYRMRMNQLGAGADPVSKFRVGGRFQQYLVVKSHNGFTTVRKMTYTPLSQMLFSEL